jgi:hypothetical protein
MKYFAASWRRVFTMVETKPDHSPVMFWGTVIWMKFRQELNKSDNFRAPFFFIHEFRAFFFPLKILNTYLLKYGSYETLIEISPVKKCNAIK